MANIKLKDYSKRLAIKDKSFAEATKTQINNNKTLITTNTTNLSNAITTNKQDADATKVIANTANTNANDWITNKGSVALLSDISTGNNITLDLAITSAVSGTITIPTTALASIPATTKVEIVFTKTGSPTYIAFDTFGDANGTSNTFGSETFTLNLTDTNIVLSSVSNQLNTTLTGYKVVRASYFATGAGGDIDQIARDAAAAAQAKANGADAKATTNATNITAETTRATTAETALGVRIDSKQESTDAALTTTAKQVVPAINEVNSSKINNSIGAQTEQQLLGYGLDGQQILIPKTSIQPDLSVILLKVIYKAGQYTAFPTTFTPNPLLWVPAGTLGGDTLIEGIQEGRTDGIGISQSLGLQGGSGVNFLPLQLIPTTPPSNTGSQGMLGLKQAGSGQISTIKYSGDIETPQTLQTKNLAAGIGVKWYKALKDITIGDL